MFSWFNSIALIRTLKAMVEFLLVIGMIIGIAGTALGITWLVIVKFGLLGFGVLLGILALCIISIISYNENLKEVRAEQKYILDKLKE